MFHFLKSDMKTHSAMIGMRELDTGLVAGTKQDHCTGWTLSFPICDKFKRVFRALMSFVVHSCIWVQNVHILKLVFPCFCTASQYNVSGGLSGKYWHAAFQCRPLTPGRPKFGRKLLLEEKTTMPKDVCCKIFRCLSYLHSPGAANYKSKNFYF